MICYCQMNDLLRVVSPYWPNFAATITFVNVWGRLHTTHRFISSTRKF